MFRRISHAVWLLIFCAFATSLPAAENPLEAVSTDAGRVIRLKAWSVTVEKAAAFVERIAPGAGEQVKAQSERIGAAISNPGLAGVDRSRDWWVAVYPKPAGQEPDVVFLIPAGDL